MTLRPDDAAGALACKPDWPQAARRWAAFWEGANDDRPLIDVKAPRPHNEPPLPPLPSLEALYMDPETVSRRALRGVATTWFGGEAVPAGGFFMGGYALGCGPGVIFAPDTVWHPVLMKDIDAPLGLQLPSEDPWTRKMEAVIQRMLDLGQGRFLVGHCCQVMANDLLALIRGSCDFLADLAQDTAKCVRRLDETLDVWTDIFEYFRTMIEARQAGCVWGWPGLWHPRMVMVSQSDMSCMISPAMFEQYVLHELDRVAERYGEMWYHVDGPNAVRHVPTLLGRPYMRCLQYVPGSGKAPNGPAYLDLYREIQAAGRGLDLDVPLEHVEFLVRRLRPQGVILRTRTKTIEQGEELLDKAVKWCGAECC